MTSAVNMPAIGAEDLEVLGPFMPLCTALGRFATAMAEGMSIERVEVELLGRIGERDARPLSTAVLLGVLRGHTEEDLNAVNVQAVAADRGIELVESRRASARDFSDLIRVTVSSARRASASSARRSAGAIARTCSRRGASASTSSSSRT